MNIWQRFEKDRTAEYNDAGISFHYEKGLDPELKKKYLAFAKWLRKTYFFPVRLNVYILNREMVRLRSGEWAYGSFRWYKQRSPRIKVPSRITPESSADHTPDEIHDTIMSSLVHELTHYYQWVLRLDQSDAVSEKQANHYRYRILDMYYADKG